MYSGPKGQNPWDALEQVVKQLMSENPDVAETLKVTQKENEDLKAKLAEMKTKVEKNTK